MYRPSGGGREVGVAGPYRSGSARANHLLNKLII